MLNICLLTFIVFLFEILIKYELISAITSNAIIDQSGYGHVNFVAKGDLPDSVDEFFFAEVRWDIDSYVPVCMVSLEGKEKSG